jgi:hypothetical protein
MEKNFRKKSNKFGKKENKTKNQAREEAKLMLGRGEVFGDSIIWNMSLFALDVKGMGVATIGLAKALAALKNVAKAYDVNITNLFESELGHFEKKYNEISEVKAN